MVSVSREGSAGLPCVSTLLIWSLDTGHPTRHAGHGLLRRHARPGPSTQSKLDSVDSAIFGETLTLNPAKESSPVTHTLGFDNALNQCRLIRQSSTWESEEQIHQERNLRNHDILPL